MALPVATVIPLAGANARMAPQNHYDFRQMFPTAGNIFFVHHSGSATGTGLSPGDAVSTIDAGINLCTASQNDHVVVLPGHAEDITTATAIACDVIGISIVGLGEGSLIPTISHTAAAGAVAITVASVRLKNLKFVANFAGGVTNAISIAAGGDGCTLDGIVMRDTTSDKEFLVHVAVATTVDDLTIKNCDFRGIIAGSMTNSILFAGTSMNTTIQDTFIHVDSSDDTIDHLAGAATACLIRRCVVVNEDTTTALYCVRHKSDGTGVTHDCRFAYNKVDAEVSVGGASWWLFNHGCNTIAEGSILEPAATHAIP